MEWEGMDCAYQVHDRGKWQSVVGHGHGPSGAVKCSDIFDSQGSVGLPRKPSLYGFRCYNPEEEI
jgi:hypothetical protein